MNVLDNAKRTTIKLLLKGGMGQREISKRTGVHRTTIRNIARNLEVTNVGEPAAQEANQSVEVIGQSASEPHREFIEKQLVLGRNAKSIYQDLVDFHGFTNGYNSVKRFVADLKKEEPEIYDVLDHLQPGEECQVDFGQGAPTRHPVSGKYKRPWLFVMVLKYSGKAFRRCVWKADKLTWARLHEMAFRELGGACKFVVLDNLKAGVIKPDIYIPQYNELYLEVLRHYGSAPDAAKIMDPDRKGSVENGVKYAQNNCLKGKTFESIEAQNDELQRWEGRWADTRIHGRKKRQVLQMFEEEKPYLIKLPPEPFQFFIEETRTVQDSGFIEVNKNFYSALPAAIYSHVRIRKYESYFVILKEDGSVLRRWEYSVGEVGRFSYEEADRIFNPTRKTEELLRRTEKVGPHTYKLAKSLFDTKGRTAQRILYGIANMAANYDHAKLEALIGSGLTNINAIKRALVEDKRKSSPMTSQTEAYNNDNHNITEYSDFFDNHHARNEGDC